MTTIRSFARLVALGLLLFAAGDLLGLGACEDGAVVNGQATALCQGDDAQAGGHQGEDCYCCSRTVRSETATGLVMTAVATVAPVEAGARFPQSPSRRLYHPPIV